MDLARDLLDKVIGSVIEYLESGGQTGPGWLADLVGDLLPDFPLPSLEGLEGYPAHWRILAERFRHLGSLDKTLLGLEEEVIDALIGLLPDFITPDQAGRILSKGRAALKRDYTLPRPEEGGYRPRQAAIFFSRENRIGRSLATLFMEAHERLEKGEIDAASKEYDVYRKEVSARLTELQNLLRDVFQVSNGQLERLLGIAGKGPGFKAGKLTGAGSGGCVCLLVERDKAEAMLAWLDGEYFGREENFAEYREALETLSRSPEEEMRRKAREMENNLREALNDPREHRRIITFSQGAGVIDVE
jgi:hypothetical protein